MTMGGHDFIVDQADSHTFGAGVGFYVSNSAKSDIFLDIGFDAQSYTEGATGSAGYYYFEIDDDVPETRGYGRNDLENKTSAASVQVYTRIDVSQNVELRLSAQQWHDGDSWLEGSQFIVDIEHTKYNLDPYDNISKNSLDYQPILPWTTIRSSELISISL